MAASSESGEHRVAVVFIHGQGQQRPMEDVRELARTTWDADPERSGEGGLPARSWVVPDARLGDADLGRVTTAAVQSGLRVDFFELYWAHLMVDNRIIHVVNWFRALLSRSRREAPRALLPVRQGTIRFIECIALMCVVFMIAVGLLLPPAEDPLALNRSELRGLPLPSPETLAWWFGLFALVFLICAIVNLFVNETGGGAAPKPIHRKPLGLQVQSLVLTAVIWCVPAGSIIVFGLVVVAGVLQGPFLQWGDARTLIFAFAMLSALALAVRRLEWSLYLGLAGATGALVCALFGGVAQANAAKLIGAHAIRPEYVSNFLNSVDPRFLLNVDTYLSTYMPHALMAVYVFATLWFVFGLIAAIAKARLWPQRLVAALVIAAVGGWIGYLIQHQLYDRAPLVWVMFSVGVTLFFTFVFMGVIGAISIYSFLVPVMADSARYLSRGPDDVNARQQIRQAGINLLDRLHDPESGYRRVIVVAHSLGTVVGYELLLDYWARFSGTYVMRKGDDLEKAVRKVEEAARDANRAPGDVTRLKTLRAAQHDVATALRGVTLGEASHGAPEGKTWLISDFITLGSPLTYSDLLMADSRRDFHQKLVNRELSACPPLLFNAQGDLDPVGVMTFKGWDGAERPTHSSVFSAVRWTNHYFSTGEMILEGDVIGGPLSGAVPANAAAAERAGKSAFGAGIVDVELEWRSTGEVFAHNEYWRSGLDTVTLCNALRKNAASAEHIAALIAAMNLDER
jgi:hypothetical protein